METDCRTMKLRRTAGVLVIGLPASIVEAAGFAELVGQHLLLSSEPGRIVITRPTMGDLDTYPGLAQRRQS